MHTKLNSEFIFEKIAKHNNLEFRVYLTLYINYEEKTYYFVQVHEEGIFPKKNNKNTHYNKAYMELALEVLEFVEKELEYGN